MPLPLRSTIRFEAEIRRTETANVIGMLPGSDPHLADEVVVFSAHHDHLGMGEPDESGDRIYNGALDNGVAMAQALAVGPGLRRAAPAGAPLVMLLFVAAEEQGLLGSKYFARNPTVPSGRLAADINFELGNIWGRTRDVTIFGKGKSTLEQTLAELAAEQGRTRCGGEDVARRLVLPLRPVQLRPRRRAGDLVQVGNRLHRPAGGLGRAGPGQLDRGALPSAQRRGRGKLELRRAGRGRLPRLPAGAGRGRHR